MPEKYTDRITFSNDTNKKRIAALPYIIKQLRWISHYEFKRVMHCRMSPSYRFPSNDRDFDSV